MLRQLLTESVMLALPGGLLGLAVAAAGTRFLLSFIAGNDQNFTLHAGLNWRILFLTLTVACGAALVFGLAPALKATRVDVIPALKETRASSPVRRGRLVGLSQVLVVFQISLSLLLVLGAALFVRTLANLHAVEIGFNQENLLTFSLDASSAGFKDTALKSFYSRLQERFRHLPGVRAATLSYMTFISNSNHGTGVKLPGAPATDATPPATSVAPVGPEFFETMQLPLLLGRPIGWNDIDGAPLAAVVNDVFAKKYFANQNPLGKQFELSEGNAGKLTIVGVAKNARYSSLKDQIPPVVYYSYLQRVSNNPPPPMTFKLRAIGNPLALADSVRKTVHDAAPNVPVTEVMTQTQQIDSTIVQERTFADLCSVFAVLALAIACVGLYGRMAYAVSRRTNEIGIRMALGAQRRRIIQMVLREVLVLAVVGLAIGLATAWAATAAIKSFLFGMKPADPLAIVATMAILSSALFLAGYAPAARASRIDPMNALRHE